MNINHRELLLNASIELDFYLEQASVVIFLLAAKPPLSKFQERTLSNIIDEMQKGVPDVISCLDNSLYEFAEISEVIHIAVSTISHYKVEPPKQITFPEDIYATSAHEAGVIFLESHCLDTGFWANNPDDLWHELPPIFDMDLLRTQIAWERMRLFKSAVMDKIVTDQGSFSAKDLENMTTLGRVQLRKYLIKACSEIPSLKKIKGRGVSYNVEQVCYILEYILQQNLIGYVRKNTEASLVELQTKK